MSALPCAHPNTSAIMPSVLAATPASGGNMKNKITGRSAFLALLKDEGITHLFGNPGSSALPLVHALKDQPDFPYGLAMQESLVVAIPDGYRRPSGKLAACTGRGAPGLGKA